MSEEAACQNTKMEPYAAHVRRVIMDESRGTSLAPEDAGITFIAPLLKESGKGRTRGSGPAEGSAFALSTRKTS